jgi:hypothetical protein
MNKSIVQYVFIAQTAWRQRPLAHSLARNSGGVFHHRSIAVRSYTDTRYIRHPPGQGESRSASSHELIMPPDGLCMKGALQVLFPPLGN